MVKSKCEKNIIMVDEASAEELKYFRDCLANGTDKFILTNNKVKLYKYKEGELFEVVNKNKISNDTWLKKILRKIDLVNKL